MLPPPAGSTVYELTELGQGLGPAVLELGRWGAHFLGQPRDTDAMQPGWFFVSVRATFRPERAAGVTETYEFRIVGETFHVAIEEGRLSVGQGGLRAPDVIVSTDLDTFISLLGQRLHVADALASGAGEVEGEGAALHRFIEIFAWPLAEDVVLT